MFALQSKVDDLKRNRLGSAVYTTSGSLSDVAVTTPESVERREVVGLVFPLNSHAALRKFCDLWKKSEEAWRAAKIAKGTESDEDALKVLPKPDHLKLVRFR